MPRLAIFAVSCMALALSGCQRGFYAAHGTVASHGGPLGHWSRPPEGCSLAPFDGLPPGQSGSVVEFAWRHSRPGYWRKQGPEDRWAQGPEMLDISRAANGITASFKLVQTRLPVQLSASDCTELRLDSHPGPPVVPGAPASLAGHLLMDCNVNGSHLTGDIAFRGCVL